MRIYEYTEGALHYYAEGYTITTLIGPGRPPEGDLVIERGIILDPAPRIEDEDGPTLVLVHGTVHGESRSGLTVRGGLPGGSGVAVAVPGVGWLVRVIAPRAIRWTARAVHGTEYSPSQGEAALLWACAEGGHALLGELVPLERADVLREADRLWGPVWLPTRRERREIAREDPTYRALALWGCATAEPLPIGPPPYQLAPAAAASLWEVAAATSPFYADAVEQAWPEAADAEADPRIVAALTWAMRQRDGRAFRAELHLPPAARWCRPLDDTLLALARILAGYDPWPEEVVDVYVDRLSDEVCREGGCGDCHFAPDPEYVQGDCLYETPSRELIDALGRKDPAALYAWIAARVRVQP